MGSKFMPYIAFVWLCFSYGTSYAVMVQLLYGINSDIFGCIRMVSSFIATSLYLFYNYRKSGFKEEVAKSEPLYQTFIKNIISGTFFLGLPISLTTLASRTVPTTIITLSQPLVPLFSLIISHFFTNDEKITARALLTQVGPIVGSILTIIPTIRSNNPSNDSASFIDLFFLFVSLICWGAGGVFIKVKLAKAEVIHSCTFSALTAALYTLASATIKNTPIILRGFFQLLSTAEIFEIAIYGIIYSTIPNFLYMYVIRTLGAVTASYTNFGQIVIGTIAGVLFLGEWSGYNVLDIILSVAGVLIISGSLLWEFTHQPKQQQPPQVINSLDPVEDENFEDM